VGVVCFVVSSGVPFIVADPRYQGEYDRVAAGALITALPRRIAGQGDSSISSLAGGRLSSRPLDIRRFLVVAGRAG